MCHNPRSAYVKARGLNATSVQEPWKKVKEIDGDLPIWKAEADRLTPEGSNVSALSYQFAHVLLR